MRLGLQGVPEEHQEVDPALGDRGADLLVTAQRSAEEAVDGQAELGGQQRARRPGCVKLMGAQRLNVEPRPLEHVRLAVVVRDQRDPLATRHQLNDITHRPPPQISWSS